LRSRHALIVLALLALGLFAGCGGDSGDDTASQPPEANLHDFPKANGKTLADLLGKLGQGGPVLAQSVSDLQPGRSRFGFALFDRSRKQISDAPTVVYIAKTGGGRALGPFKARSESLAVKPQFQSQTVASDPDAAQSMYVADIPFPAPGKYDVIGMARLDGRLVAATPAAGPVQVTKVDQVPGVGDSAPLIHTPIPSDVGGDLSQIDTRQPPAEDLHKVDFADVVGKKPIVLVFATPLLCQSRVCGPVVDIAQEVKSERKDDVQFIHMEIYNNNSIDQGFRQQVLQWKLPTEPWVFAVDRNGKIAARIEGAYSADELRAAIDKATKG
jgi:hypothetical protein